MQAKIYLDAVRRKGKISDVFYGSFVEHMGRCVYGGVYEEGSPLSDEKGWRRDVEEKVRGLNLDIVRYPGGNFVSGYNWKDGIGPKDLRPQKLDLAWMQLEPNRVGVLEFCDWARRSARQVMMAVNLGTGTAKDAQELVEYCNAERGYWAEKRAEHGRRDPLGIRYWCLGNEMDGDWQICTHTAEEYGRKAQEAAKLMKWVDPDIRLVACGSSAPTMASFPRWDRVVLEHVYEQADCISMHRYYNHNDGNLDDYLSAFVDFGAAIDSVISVCDYVKAYKRSKKTMKISFDEWNVSNAADPSPENERGKWIVGARRSEAKYDFLDGIALAQLLSVLVNHADRVEITCQAQLVNVLGLIFAEKEGSFCQSIYYPFALASQYLRGEALDVLAESPVRRSEKYGEAPLVQCAAAYDGEEERLCVYAINASLEEAAELEISLAHFGKLRLNKIYSYESEDISARNGLSGSPVGVRAIAQNIQVSESCSVQIPPHTLRVYLFEKG